MDYNSLNKIRIHLMLTLMNEIMSFAATKMDLDIVILSEVS